MNKTIRVLSNLHLKKPRPAQKKKSDKEIFIQNDLRKWLINQDAKIDGNQLENIYTKYADMKKANKRLSKIKFENFDIEKQIKTNLTYSQKLKQLKDHLSKPRMTEDDIDTEKAMRAHDFLADVSAIIPENQRKSINEKDDLLFDLNLQSQKSSGSEFHILP